MISLAETSEGAAVYRDGVLVGIFVTELVAPWTTVLPSVFEPTGEEHALHPVSTSTDALAAIEAAASEYTYHPHTGRVSVSRDPATGQARYRLCCPTCLLGGLPPTPYYASAVEAARHAEADHHAATGHRIELREQPEPLRPAGPPTNSPYYRR